MGKYSMTKSKRKYTATVRDLYGNSAVSDDGFNAFRYLFGDVGIFGIKPLKMFDEYMYMSDYLKNRGLSWSDMKYPTIASHSGGVATFRVNDKAVERLYR